jgi:TPP-dependent pyruvate/acetoin dehydrogenase alpha subunit
LRHHDPLLRTARELVAVGYASREELITRDKDARTRIAAAADYAIASPMPDPATVSNHVFASARSDR